MCPIALTPSSLEDALQDVSTTIESISIHINGIAFPADAYVLDFRHFNALKHLCIPSRLFIEEGSATKKWPMPILANTLPPTLETIKLQFYPDNQDLDPKGRGAFQVSIHFILFVAGMLRVMRHRFRALPVLWCVKMSIKAPDLTIDYPKLDNLLGHAPLGNQLQKLHKRFVETWARQRKVECTLNKTAYGKSKYQGSREDTWDRIDWVVEAK